MSVTYSWELPADSTAPGQGRWHMRELLPADTEAIDAELVVTELITNAWRHGRGSITFQAELRDDSVVVRVCSDSDDDPHVETDAGGAGGRGLLLIGELTRSWGFEREGDRLCVWAEVAAN